MADSTGSLRRRIGSAGDLQAIVRAMKAQAAAAIGQYETSVAALADYASTVEQGIGVCLRQQRVDVPVDTVAPMRRQLVGAIVFGSDQGLVGRFNDVVVEHAMTVLAQTGAASRVWAVGERAAASLSDHAIDAQATFAVPATVHGITTLVGDLLAKVADDTDLTELRLVCNRPSTGSGYEPVDQRLLPLDTAWGEEIRQRRWPAAMVPETIGDVGHTLRALIREYLFISLFRACAESFASENASRLAAMDRADRNIDKMLVTLGDRFHRLRQAGIDEELSDVIAGFTAAGT